MTRPMSRPRTLKAALHDTLESLALMVHQQAQGLHGDLAEMRVVNVLCDLGRAFDILEGGTFDIRDAYEGAYSDETLEKERASLAPEPSASGDDEESEADHASQ